MVCVHSVFLFIVCFNGFFRFGSIFGFILQIILVSYSQFQQNEKIKKLAIWVTNRIIETGV